MFRSVPFIFPLAFLFASCSGKLPDWLQGQWQQQADTARKNQILSIWTFKGRHILHKTNKTEDVEIVSNSEATIEQIKEPTRFIIRTELKNEPKPYFQVFKKISETEILYYDSSAFTPRQEFMMSRTAP